MPCSGPGRPGDDVGEHHVAEARTDVLHHEQALRTACAQQVTGAAARERVVRAVLEDAQRFELHGIIGTTVGGESSPATEA